MKIALQDPKEARFNKDGPTKSQLLEMFSDSQVNYLSRTKSQSLVPVADNLAGDRYHNGYMGCLETAWRNHLGIVVTPDILWHSLLSEVAQIVAEAPARYATLFTTIPDKKQTVIVVTGELVVMPLDQLVDALKPLVPTRADVFLPEFTTSTPAARMARYAAFADVVSPYYNYCMVLCGIPYVDVRGDREDYRKIAALWGELGSLLPGHEAYFAAVQERLETIAERLEDTDMWQEMFWMKKCGSGSEVDAYGWWTDLQRVQPRTRHPSNFPPHLAKVKYRQLDTRKDYEMIQGILSSATVGDCLVPNFGFVVLERPEHPIVTPLPEEPRHHRIITYSPGGER